MEQVKLKRELKNYKQEGQSKFFFKAENKKLKKYKVGTTQHESNMTRMQFIKHAFILYNIIQHKNKTQKYYTRKYNKKQIAQK